MVAVGCQKKDVDPPENKIPVADAGPSSSITLPANIFNLSGSGTDLDGKIVAYLWSQVSGPFSATIPNPGSPATEVDNLIKGTYVFQLMVTDDKGAIGVDTTTLVVNPPAIQTLTLQPANNPTEAQVEILNGQDHSYTGGPEISIDAWTTSAQPWTLRNVFKFDLSSIPATSTIISANLYLYSTSTPLTGNLINANYGTNNSMYLQQVTNAWSPSTITWFNQPSVSTTNEINIATTNQSILDLNVDVTGMVTAMINNNANYGFLLRLQNETIYNSRIFVSSYNTTYADKHPRLVVVYK